MGETWEDVFRRKACEYGDEIEKLKEEIFELKRRLAKYESANESISQALNEGNGIYKP
jgi:cell division septum initiation protein DivIVA